MASRKLSHDQKRKQKLAKRHDRQRGDGFSLQPYTGSKFRNDRLVSWHLAAERGIREVDIVLQGRMTDQQVVAALTRLAKDLRNDTDLLGEPMPDGFGGDAVDLVWFRIQRNWNIDIEQEMVLLKPDAIGVLRSILGSIAAHRRAGAESRGYLTFLRDFLVRAGGDPLTPLSETEGRRLHSMLLALDPDLKFFEKLRDDAVDELDDDLQDGDPNDDAALSDVLVPGAALPGPKPSGNFARLYTAGSVWLHNPEGPQLQAFRDVAEALMADQNSQTVYDVCQSLLRDYVIAQRHALKSVLDGLSDEALAGGAAAEAGQQTDEE